MRGGGGADLNYNSVTPEDINMKFFKFNFTPVGVILHILTILIKGVIIFYLTGGGGAGGNGGDRVKIID